MRVATNGPREKAELTLGLTGLLPHVGDRLFCAYEVGYWKPDPRLFLHAAQALGVPAATCAVVEDSRAGVEAGLAAGMRVFSLCAPGVPCDSCGTWASITRNPDTVRRRDKDSPPDIW